MVDIKAVIYDVDGTMVDSEPLHVAAWDHALQIHGHKLSDLSKEFLATMAGKKPIVIADGMVNELRLHINKESLLAKKSELFMELVSTQLKPMIGVTESLKQLREDGYRLAIGTSLDRNYVNIVLAKLDIVTFFEVIVTGDQIRNGKPDPETYLTVCEQLGLMPSECVVLEDATSGIQSAKAAGTWCIAVENKLAATQDTSQADVVVYSLSSATKELIDSITQ